MKNRTSGKIWVVHKIAAVVTMITAVLFLIQFVCNLAMTDDARLEMTKAAAKVDRNHYDFSPAERPLSDDELDKRILERREELLREDKVQRQTSSTLIMEALALISLLAMALLLLKNRRSPTRVLALVISVLLIVETLAVLGHFTDNRLLELYKYIPSSSAILLSWFYSDIGLLIMVPLSLIFCLITAIKPPAKPEIKEGK